MPSGAKKRKAAKKKKEIQSNNNPSSHGDDVGEVSSPASQDSRNPLTGEETEKGEDNVVRVEREFKSGRDEAGRKSSSSSSSSSGSSSSGSDDESHDAKDSSAVVDVPPVVERVEVVEPVSESPVVSVDSANAEVECVSVEETPLVKEKVEVNTSSYEVESVSQEKGEVKVNSGDEEVGIAAALVDTAPETKEVGTVIEAVETVSESSDPKGHVEAEVDSSLTLSYNSSKPAVDNAAEQQKDYGVTQPMLPVTQHPQTTSWKSCCGLFEVFAGSST